MWSICRMWFTQKESCGQLYYITVYSSYGAYSSSSREIDAITSFSVIIWLVRNVGLVAAFFSQASTVAWSAGAGCLCWVDTCTLPLHIFRIFHCRVSMKLLMYTSLFCHERQQQQHTTQKTRSSAIASFFSCCLETARRKSLPKIAEMTT